MATAKAHALRYIEPIEKKGYNNPKREQSAYYLYQ